MAARSRGTCHTCDASQRKTKQASEMANTDPQELRERNAKLLKIIEILVLGVDNLQVGSSTPWTPASGKGNTEYCSPEGAEIFDHDGGLVALVDYDPDENATTAKKICDSANLAGLIATMLLPDLEGDDAFSRLEEVYQIIEGTHPVQRPDEVLR
jgi:hypothetical protein